MSTDRYTSPFCERYASKEMQYIFSPDKKFKTWRKLWIALAETEYELGLSENGKPVISQEQIDELKAHAEDINYDVAKEREKMVRHDVMSHVYAYGVQCPKAAGIIHLGATSCYVGDNTDVIVMTEAMKLVRKKLLNVINELSKFAMEYKDLPTLAFTHFQPAQPTTVGKRATLWLQELMLDLSDLDYMIGQQKLLGCKGTTGTQASFLELFNGDHEKVLQIDKKIAEKMGLPGIPDFGVSWYKTGGIFNDPSVIGVGEAGSEAVVPLDKLWEKFDQMAEAIIQASGGNVINQEININQPTSSPIETARAIKRQMKFGLAGA